MSTSDQDGHRQLTRKQLRELRLTGSTPVISEEEAAQAAQPAPVLPRAAEPVQVEPASQPEPEIGEEGGRLTRRQARERERMRTASVPVVGEDAQADAGAEAELVEPAAPEPVAAPPVEPVADEAVAEETVEAVAEETVEPVAEVPVAPSVESAAVTQPAPEAAPAEAEPEIVSAIPVFQAAPASEAPVDAGHTDDDESHGESTPEVEAESTVAAMFAAQDDAQKVPAAEERPAPAEQTADEQAAVEGAAHDEPAPATSERPMVGAAFGLGLKQEQKPEAFPALFDDLLEGGSAGSHHTAPSALIFTHTPGVGSLSGPVAATGELLITGTYELPEGLGSQGHALGAADGKDVDAVLIDGELAPASSPTPIAASAAVSTSKPAGEVIRPPAPEKGNKLMITLAIVAGGLALVLAATLIIAFTSNVFGG